MNNLFQNEVETLIRLAREAAGELSSEMSLYEAGSDGSEEMSIQEQIERISKRLEGYFKDHSQNSRNFELDENE